MNLSKAYWHPIRGTRTGMRNELIVKSINLPFLSFEEATSVTATITKTAICRRIGIIFFILEYGFFLSTCKRYCKQLTLSALTELFMQS